MIGALRRWWMAGEPALRIEPLAWQALLDSSPLFARLDDAERARPPPAARGGAPGLCPRRCQAHDAQEGVAP